MTAQAPAKALSGSWKADPVHSRVGFEVEHLGVSTFQGRFRDYDAAVAVGGEGLRITGTARVAGVDVDDEGLLAHLLSPDFFDAEREPEIRFDAGDVRFEGDELRASGELTLRGRSRPVEVQGRLGEPGIGIRGEERVALELEATVDRRDFGIDLNMRLPNGKDMIGNEVRLLAHLELVRED